ncbi:MAG: sulfatase-like hydrolase/transferase [Myxococcota bacterium]|jgi:arylsulfatase A-like enzyme|nr:sulfatase-like hydrolase/transferase [Myxococcota bacterium]
MKEPPNAQAGPTPLAAALDVVDAELDAVDAEWTLLETQLEPTASDEALSSAALELETDDDFWLEVVVEEPVFEAAPPSLHPEDDAPSWVEHSGSTANEPAPLHLDTRRITLNERPADSFSRPSSVIGRVATKAKARFSLLGCLLALLFWLEASVWSALLASMVELWMVLQLGQHPWDAPNAGSITTLTVLGAFVPVALGMGGAIWAALLLGAWWRRPSELATVLWRWGRSKDPAQSGRRSAALIATIAAVPAGMMLAAKGIDRAGWLFATEFFNAVLWAFVALLVFAATAWLARASYLALAGILGFAFRRWPRLTWPWSTPLAMLLWCASAGIAGFSYVAWVFVYDKGLEPALVLMLVPLVLLPVALMPIARALDALQVLARRRFLRVIMGLGRLAIVGLLLLATSLGLFRSGALPPGLEVSSRTGALTPFFARVVRALTDFDKDGYSHLLGGGDCAPFDRTVNPAATEVIDNGIDDNCLGGDLTSERIPQAPAPSYIDIPGPCGKSGGCNILFISIDSLRADRLSAYGQEEDLSPNIDKLAQRGVVFEEAYCVGPGTALSIPPLFSVLYDTQIKLDKSKGYSIGPRPLSHEHTLFPQLLAKHGYSTAAVAGHQYIEPLRYGFQRFDNPRSKWSNNKAVSSPELTERAIKQYDRLRKGKQPFFLWVHYYDPHHDYIPHDGLPAKGRSAMELYNGEVRFTDEWMGQLLAHIDANPASRPLVIAVTADHGEGLGDHGIRYHNRNFYRSLCQLPLIFVAPGAEPRRIVSPVSLNDMGPTFLNIAGAQPEPLHEGRSLADAIFLGQESLDRTIFHQAVYEQGGTNYEVFGLTTAEWRLFRDRLNNVIELYDAQNDPAESTNLATQRPDIVSGLMETLDGFLFRVEKR